MKAGTREKKPAADLAAIVELPGFLVLEPEPQPLLRVMMLVEVFRHSEHPVEEKRADLNRGFPHPPLERRGTAR